MSANQMKWFDLDTGVSQSDDLFALRSIRWVGYIKILVSTNDVFLFSFLLPICHKKLAKILPVLSLKKKKKEVYLKLNCLLNTM